MRPRATQGGLHHRPPAIWRRNLAPIREARPHGRLLQHRAAGADAPFRHQAEELHQAGGKPDMAAGRYRVTAQHRPCDGTASPMAHFLLIRVIFFVGRRIPAERERAHRPAPRPGAGRL